MLNNYVSLSSPAAYIIQLSKTRAIQPSVDQSVKTHTKKYVHRIKTGNTYPHYGISLSDMSRRPKTCILSDSWQPAGSRRTVFYRWTVSWYRRPFRCASKRKSRRGVWEGCIWCRVLLSEVVMSFVGYSSSPRGLFVISFALRRRTHHKHREQFNWRWHRHAPRSEKGKARGIFSPAD